MGRYRAVVCDLLTALVDSWTLWAEVAGDADLGRRWRDASLRLVTASGRYQPYERLVAEAAREVGVPDGAPAQVLARWGELRPYPDVGPALAAAKQQGLALGVVTNCSQRLAELAAARVPVGWDVVLSAETTGWYKPRPEPYRLTCEALGVRPEEALYVAGSAHDVPGAVGAGMDTLWVNRRNLPTPDGVAPLAILPTLERLPDYLAG